VLDSTIGKTRKVFPACQERANVEPRQAGAIPIVAAQRFRDAANKSDGACATGGGRSTSEPLPEDQDPAACQKNAAPD
jgi:hypothetical protein